MTETIETPGQGLGKMMGIANHTIVKGCTTGIISNKEIAKLQVISKHNTGKRLTINAAEHRKNIS